jgi:hypothetical protein
LSKRSSLQSTFRRYLGTSFGFVETPTPQSNNSHGHHVRIGVTLIDVVVVGVGPVVVDVVVVVVIVSVGRHDGGNVEGTAVRALLNLCPAESSVLLFIEILQIFSNIFKQAGLSNRRVTVPM